MGLSYGVGTMGNNQKFRNLILKSRMGGFGLRLSLQNFLYMR